MAFKSIAFLTVVLSCLMVLEMVVTQDPTTPPATSDATSDAATSDATTSDAATSDAATQAAAGAQPDETTAAAAEGSSEGNQTVAAVKIPEGCPLQAFGSCGEKCTSDADCQKVDRPYSYYLKCCPCTQFMAFFRPNANNTQQQGNMACVLARRG